MSSQDENIYCHVQPLRWMCSFGELEWMGTGKAKIQPLDLTQPMPKMSYKDGYQKRYFCLDSFIDGAAMLTDFANELKKK